MNVRHLHVVDRQSNITKESDALVVKKGHDIVFYAANRSKKRDQGEAVIQLTLDDICHTKPEDVDWYDIEHITLKNNKFMRIPVPALAIRMVVISGNWNFTVHQDKSPH